MGLKADFPDAIDSGAGYDLADVSGWGGKVVGLGAGTMLATVGVGLGYRYGRDASTWLRQTASGASEGASSNDGVFNFE